MFGPHFETQGDSFLDVGQCLVAGLPLADTTGDRWTFGNPNAVFVPFQSGGKLHSINLGGFCKMIKRRQEKWAHVFGLD